jgi:hypothetical protein
MAKKTLVRKVDGSWLGVPVRKMKPTLEHRPALWECMLGTVYARNDEGVTKYFDYDLEGAKEYAGVANPHEANLRDARLYKNWDPRYYPMGDGIVRSTGTSMPSVKQLVLWVKEIS